jgi:hypothetical protein
MNIAVNILRAWVPQIGEYGMLLQERLKFKSASFKDPHGGRVPRVAKGIESSYSQRIRESDHRSEGLGCESDAPFSSCEYVSG